MNWTTQQQEVIDTREKNILVSAAAGSGKTAVLTARILSLITDEEHPIDVDELVVVTFTRAAAGEMRERILQALQKKSDEYLEKLNAGLEVEKNLEHYQYMQRQLSFLHNARITTIDSFCLDVVREHFALLELDPAFRIGEEGELTLLRADVMAKLLEECYEEADENFLNFVDVYSSNRSDEEIENLILLMYRFAMSYPFPEEWVRECVLGYQNCGEHMEESGWYQALMAYVDKRLLIVQEQIERVAALAKEEDGPQAYLPAALSDKAFLQAVLESEDYDHRQKLFYGYKAEALSRKKQPDASEEKKELFKSIRDEYKKILKDISEKYFKKTREEVVSDIEAARQNAEVLSDLVVRFIHKYAQAKREKNLVDFSDLEHFALHILTERKEDGTVVPSSVANNMSAEIAEIMIDEYQDSNYVQEMILTAISGKSRNCNNLFMVGDVKQSIYKFRMAKPELFLEKYQTFEREGENPNRKIILSKNFRSRKRVLDAANCVFEKIMTEELGGISYDEENALYYGADYPETDSEVEVLIADTSSYEDSKEAADLDDDVSARELEAEMVALKVRKMMQENFQVLDKQSGQMRKVRYSDMVLLLRSITGYGEVYERVFTSYGIPVRCPVKKGCFDSFEVKSILEFLSIIDNPRQDIPLACVLKNMFRLSDEEIATIKIYGGEKSFYKNVRKLCAGEEDSRETAMENMAGEEKELLEKLGKFWDLLQKYRKMKSYLGIYDLIPVILKDTGFEYFVAALPSGKTRLFNLQMLRERAFLYQKSSYSGLFDFVRYIEKNEQYEIEQETIANGEVMDAVTLMSIHKSKGLEFPVVFVAGMGKRFNQDDMNKKVVLHSGYGIGLDMYDKQRCVRTVTLIKRSIASQILMENMAEELRVLYVAMTRAKEKLILCGSGGMKNKFPKYARSFDARKEQNRKVLHLNELLGAGSYLDWVLMAAGIEGEEGHWKIPEPGFSLTVETPQSLAEQLVQEQVLEKDAKEVLENWDAKQVYQPDIRKMVEKSFSFVYPYEQDITLKAKVSVSDIKQQMMKAYDEQDELAEDVSGFQEEVEIVPKFLQEEGQVFLSGANRGIAYHRIFELLDYEQAENKEMLQAQLEYFLQKKWITEEIKNSISPAKIMNFIKSDIGQRMKQAAKRGDLYREQQFVMNIPAGFVDENYSGEENVLVQGIVDAWFEENGKIYVVDYKTDHVKHAQELAGRYQAQLLYYGYAVQKITGKELGELLIYSTELGETISISETNH